jgi:CIC family chloride channel protein
MNSHPSLLRDFTVDRRVWFLSAIAVGIGSGAAILAVLLLKCIALATNIFYYHRISFENVGPAGSPLGYGMVFVPIVGGLIVGLMARYGSDKIRGHGIPEAIEAILLRGARVEPSVALLKPISAAISIGSGGPFGAEGPIIMTGGAFGSLVAQWIRLTDAERTTLLVAGAAAGMSATFASPLAAILLAVELLLFEFRPRSLAPVAFASITAAVIRVHWLGAGPLFPVPVMGAMLSAKIAIGAILTGLLIGVAAAGLSTMMYGFEDMFARLPVHWMWWPAIGGIGIGVGGLFFPRGLGVGYDNIGELLRGNAPLALLAGLIVCKSLMWAFSLGSGTSGGVLAPLLMIGGAIGELIAHYAGAGVEMQALWAMVGMAAMLSGSLGVPLTAIVFTLEITHSIGAMAPVMMSCIGAYLVTSLILPRSILTEKIARRGFHLTRECGVDPLEMISVGEVMAADQGLVVEAALPLPEFYAYSDETSRSAAERMATSGLDQLIVVDRKTKAVCGVVNLRDLLAGRKRAMERENDRVRVFMEQRDDRVRD